MAIESDISSIAEHVEKMDSALRGLISLVEAGPMADDDHAVQGDTRAEHKAAIKDFMNNYFSAYGYGANRW